MSSSLAEDRDTVGRPTLLRMNESIDLIPRLEAILFVAGKPLTPKQLAAATAASRENVVEALGVLQGKYSSADAGLMLVEANNEWQMVTKPAYDSWCEKFIKAEVLGELTRPQLEALTVIAYCGPLTKAELEQIRGVNCSLILRNLTMRGLIAESPEHSPVLPAYQVTVEFLKHLGLASVTELPAYSELAQHEHIRSQIQAAAQNISA